MRSIGISAKLSSPEALAYAADVARDLRKRGLAVCFDNLTSEALANHGEPVTCEKSELGDRNDLLITFGGDGTLLSVARHAPSDVPIIGVNMGTLGFLTEIRVEEFPTVLEEVLAGRFQSEARVALDVCLATAGEDDRHYRVLNDAVINKSALARMIEMHVSVSGLVLSTFRADGLIVSTPTGSTAYNLSAGGPIVYPTMAAIVITPICPHMLTNRPVVLPDYLEVTIGLEPTREEIYLTLDGQEGVPVSERNVVTISKSKHTVQLVRSPSKDYFDVLRTKLKWGSVT